ncbi:MAG: hypothetical protein AMXMBFR61_03300 [Fimbriimonadales bacterium]
MNVRSLRSVCAFLFASLGATSHAVFSGTYVDASGQAHAWQVSAENALIWDGQPWVPLGPIVPASETDRLAAVASAGLTGVLLRFPLDAPLAAVTDAAEKAGLPYVLSPEGAAPMASGHFVMPQSYRVANIKGEMDLRLRVPGSDTTFWVLVEADTYGIVTVGHAKVDAGFATILVRPRRTGNYVLLLYPHATAGNVVDLWEGYDLRRDTLLAKLRAARLGPGLRAIADPLGEHPNWYDFRRRFVPESALFRLEFERYLSRTYGAVHKLAERWQLQGMDLDSFGEAARMVPLFAEGRGIPYLWDPDTDKLRAVARTSKYWQDMEAFLQGAAVERASNLAAALRRVADVPVVYTWRGWSATTQDKTASGQGLGITGFGSGFSAASTYGAHAVGASLTWLEPPWLPALVIAPDPSGGRYDSASPCASAVAALASVGAKGFFVRSALDDDSLRALVAASHGIADAGYSPKTLEFPETAQTPADVMQLPGGVWWVPSPRAGARLDFGETLEAYRITRPDGTATVLWSRAGRQQVSLRAFEPRSVRVAAADATLIEPRVRRDGLTVVVDESPIVLLTQGEIPVPEVVFKETDDALRALFKDDTLVGTDLSDLKYDYNLAVESAPRSPGAAYLKLREVYWKLLGRLGRYIWIEGESPSKTTFGYVESSAAAMEGSCLVVDTPFEPLGGAYTASYVVNVPSDSTMQLYLAGSLHEGGTLRFEFQIDDGTPVPFRSEPLSRYGGRFAWYDGGVVSLKKGRRTLTISVRGEPGAYYDAAIDAITLTTGSFRPVGTRKPSVTK